MCSDNSRNVSVNDSQASTSCRYVLRRIGTAVLVAGLAVLAYGAVAFWLINNLPPNGGAWGRLPSVYVMGVGMVVALFGLTAREFRFRRKVDSSGKVTCRGIPTWLGVLVFLVIAALLVFVISRM